MVTAFLPVCATNLQTHTVIYFLHSCSHPSKTPSRSLNLFDVDVYVVMTPMFPTNQRKCANSSRSVAILIHIIYLLSFIFILLSTQLNTVLNRSLDSQHCKCHRRKRSIQPPSQKHQFKELQGGWRLFISGEAPFYKSNFWQVSGVNCFQ